MTLTQKSVYAAAVAAAVLFTFIAFGNTQSKASTTLQSAVATSSTVQVGTANVQTLFAAKSSCAARTISTQGQPIMISFSADITPNASRGNVQAASTTVTYDSGQLGCDLVRAYGFNSSTTVTVTETN